MNLQSFLAERRGIVESEGDEPIRYAMEVIRGMQKWDNKVRLGKTKRNDGKVGFTYGNIRGTVKASQIDDGKWRVEVYTSGRRPASLMVKAKSGLKQVHKSSVPGFLFRKLRDKGAFLEEGKKGDEGIDQVSDVSIKKKEGSDNYWYVKKGAVTIGVISKDDDGKYDADTDPEGGGWYKQGFKSTKEAASWIVKNNTKAHASDKKESTDDELSEAGGMTYRQAHKKLIKLGYYPEAGTSRYVNSKKEYGRIEVSKDGKYVISVGAKGPGKVGKIIESYEGLEEAGSDKKKSDAFLKLVHGLPSTKPDVLRREAKKHGVKIVKERPYRGSKKGRGPQIHVKLPDGRYGFFDPHRPEYMWSPAGASNYESAEPTPADIFIESRQSGIRPEVSDDELFESVMRTAPLSRTVHERRMYLSEATTWDSKAFCEYIQKHAKVGNKSLKCDHHNQFSKTHDEVIITFINLPGDQGGKQLAGGARAMNNRYQISVEGFAKNLGEPPPSGKVKAKTMTASPVFKEAGVAKMRGKTATPEKIAKYVADYISKLAKTEPSTR